MMTRPPLLAALLAMSLMTGCLEQGVMLNKPPGIPATSSQFNGNPARLRSIELRVPEFTQLETGQSAQLEVIALDDQGNRIDPSLLDLVWQAKDNSLISVDAKGMITGLKPVSISDITVTDRLSQQSDTALVTVIGPYTGDPSLLDHLIFAVANQTLEKAGSSVQFRLIAVDTQGRPIDPAKLGPISWNIGDKTAYSLDATGLVTALLDTGAVTPVTATHSTSGKQALGSVDMLHSGSPSGATSSSPPSPSPVASPSSSASPSPQPSSPAPTVMPPSPTPLPTPAPNALARLVLSPGSTRFGNKGDAVDFVVQAFDTAGHLMDVASLNLVWSTDQPLIFTVTGAGQDAKVVAARNSGSGVLTVTDPQTGIKAEATLRISTGSGGGGGGSASAPPPLVNCAGDLEPLSHDDLLIDQILNPTLAMNSSVAMDDFGNFIVVWSDENFEGPLNLNIKARLYNNQGEAISSAFLVSSFSGVDAETDPDVAMDSEGNYVVVWSGAGTEDGKGIYAKAFSPCSSTGGSEFLINQAIEGRQWRPAVAMDNDGDYVVTWDSYEQGSYEVKARLFSAGSSVGGTEFQVNESTSRNERAADVAMDADGDYVITWTSHDCVGVDCSNAFVMARSFSAGQTSGASEFLVSESSDIFEGNTAIAMNDDGDFSIAWFGSSGGNSNFGDHIRSKYFEAGTNPSLSNLIQVAEVGENEYVTPPKVGMDAGGNFLVTWSDSRGDIPQVQHIMARAYSSGGVSADPEFQVSPIESTTGIRARVAMDPAGNLAIIWFSGDHPLDLGNINLIARYYAQE